MEEFDYEKVNEIISVYQKLSSKTDEVFTELNGIMKILQSKSIWSGEAADYYCDEFVKLMKNNEDISIAMQNLALFLTKISENYQNLENQLSGIMKG